MKTDVLLSYANIIFTASFKINIPDYLKWSGLLLGWKSLDNKLE